MPAVYVSQMIASGAGAPDGQLGFIEISVSNVVTLPFSLDSQGVHFRVSMVRKTVW
jgi:hypothetical protein